MKRILLPIGLILLAGCAPDYYEIQGNTIIPHYEDHSFRVMNVGYCLDKPGSDGKCECVEKSDPKLGDGPYIVCNLGTP